MKISRLIPGSWMPLLIATKQTKRQVFRRSSKVKNSEVG